MLRNAAPFIQRRVESMDNPPVHTLVLTKHWSIEDQVLVDLGPKLSRLAQLHLDGVRPGTPRKALQKSAIEGRRNSERDNRVAGTVLFSCCADTG